MWNALRSRWPVLAALPLLCCGLVPLRVVAAPNTTVSLNGVALDATYADVLASKGMPRLIGPALANADDINNLLRFPPGFMLPNSTPPSLSTATATPGEKPPPPTFTNPYLDPTGTNIPWDASNAGATITAATNPSGMPPWAQQGGARSAPPWAQQQGGGSAPPWAQQQGGGSAPPWAQQQGGGSAPPWMQGNGGNRGLPAINVSASTTPAQKIKGQSKYLAWSYKKDGYQMYVILDREKGLVSAVVLWLTNPMKFTKPVTPKSITFGSSVSQIISVYDYPDYSTKVGAVLLYYYPDQDITFSIDTATRKVVGIAIANKSLTAIMKSAVEDNDPSFAPVTTENGPQSPFGGGGMSHSPFSPFGGAPMGGLPGNHSPFQH